MREIDDLLRRLVGYEDIAEEIREILMAKKKRTHDQEVFDEVVDLLQPIAEFSRDCTAMAKARRMLDAMRPPRGRTLGEQAIIESGGIPG